MKNCPKAEFSSQEFEHERRSSIEDDFRRSKPQGWVNLNEDITILIVIFIHSWKKDVESDKTLVFKMKN